MNKVLIAIPFTLALTLAAQTSFAQSFAPWERRGIAPEMGAGSTMIMPTGFAPWRDRDVVKDGAPDKGGDMGDAFANVFRPWS